MATLVVGKLKRGWRIIQQYYENKKRISKVVPRISYEALGLLPTDTIEQAREKIKRLNKQNSIQRRRQSSIVNTAKRILEIEETEIAFLPPEIVSEFTTRIESDSFGSEGHVRKLYSRWKLIQLLIKDLKLRPQQFFDHKRSVYKYFAKYQFSLDYTNKCIKMLNDWGAFYAGANSAIFRPVPTPRGIEREAIAKAHKLKPNLRGPSNPLTPIILDKAKLTDANYNWLFISMWFGLRPEEVDSLHNDSMFMVTTQKSKTILQVYQTKLVALPEEDRWKLIPCLHSEQIKAIKLINQKQFKRPSAHTMHLIGKGIGLYGGRKGFELLMREKGHPIEHIASWLGHQSIETTWNKYRNRRVASF